MQVTNDLEEDFEAVYVCNKVRKNPEYAGSLKDIREHSSTKAISTAIESLINKDQPTSRTTCMILSMLQHWIITYLCGKMMQLMTPETLVIKRNLIPSYYIKLYLNHQCHFSLKQLIKGYHESLYSGNW